MRFAEQPVSSTVGLRAAAKPGNLLADLMVSGGDERLRVDPATGLNGYGCSPVPRPDELTFSSSTASTISNRAFSRAETALRLLSDDREFAGGDSYEQLTEQLRQDLKTNLELGSGTELILSPSGTDSTLHALFIAQQVVKRPVVSIVLAADETGTGVGLAASGRHFGAIACGGRPVIKAEPIVGLATPSLAMPIAARDSCGQARNHTDVDDECLRKVADLAAAGVGAIVHVMDQSKTGLRYPSDACLLELIERHGQFIQIVVDACQTRLSRSRLKWYIEHGCLVLITGSKFFTGPPLSGALIVPESLANRTARINDIPRGLPDYTSRHDWPGLWSCIRSQLPARTNVGQLLRWIAAAEEMRAYFAVPELARNIALREFGSVIARAIAQFSELKLLNTNFPAGNQGDNPDEFDTRTIFSFVIVRNSRLLSYDDSRLVFRAMNAGVPPRVRARRAFAGPDLTTVACRIGQPVAVADGSGGHAGAFRISVDARMISGFRPGTGESWVADGARRIFNDLSVVLHKLMLLVHHLDGIQSDIVHET